MCCNGQIPVSVIMGTLYRRENTTLLKRSVESILNQTFSDFEFIICDTGSTAEAVAYLESLTDPRVKIIRRDGCFGLAQKLNLCLKESAGRYIARMDDDDLSYPDRLERELDYLETSGAAFVGCNVLLIQAGERVGQRVLPEFPTVEDFYFTQPYIHPTLIFRREALETVDGYSESRDCLLCEDYDLLLRLYRAGYTGANLQENLLDYTIPSNPKDGRTMRHRVNEMKTRYRRFRELGKLPKALPYVVKPVVVGLLPDDILAAFKRKSYKRKF